MHQTGNCSHDAPGVRPSRPTLGGQSLGIFRQHPLRGPSLSFCMKVLKVNFVTRVQVRLLGPCFKTGQQEQGNWCHKTKSIWRRDPANARHEKSLRGCTAANTPRSLPVAHRFSSTLKCRCPGGFSTAVRFPPVIPKGCTTHHRREDEGGCSSTQVTRRGLFGPNRLWQRLGRRLVEVPAKPPSHPDRKPEGLQFPSSQAASNLPREYPKTAAWFQLFTSRRFHALLNSLFKVLFNFPSRYLFAIGLVVIFSFRWSLPPS